MHLCQRVQESSFLPMISYLTAKFYYLFHYRMIVIIQ